MRHPLLLAGALLALGTQATAQSYDTFDSYSNGTSLHNLGGWFGWDNSPAAAGIVDNTFAFSPPNSMFCTSGIDAVRPDIGATSGRWTVRVMQYIPNGGVATAPVYFILNNQYNHGGPYQWAGQLQCNGSTIDDDLRPSTARDLIFDQWVEIRADINLDTDRVAYYYNGLQISEGDYARGGIVELQNIDLFSNGGSCYWDDVTVEQVLEDDFDSYPNGTSLSDVGGWFGWDNDPTVAGIVDGTRAFSAPHSMLCRPGVSAVHPDLGAVTGRWTVKAMQYVPAGGLNNGQLVINLNNVYAHGGPYNWASQLTFSGTTVDDGQRTSTARQVSFDRWVPIRVDIDLDAGTIAHYYDNLLVSQGTYATAGGPDELQNIGLASNGGTCYWDDIVVEPAIPSLAENYGAGCPGSAGTTPSIGTVGLATPGDPSFAITLEQATPNSNATLLFAWQTGNTPLGPCTLLLNLPADTITSVGADAQGMASVSLPIPSSIAPGMNVYMQWVVLDPGGGYLNLLTFSDGLSLRLGR